MNAEEIMQGDVDFYLRLKGRIKKFLESKIPWFDSITDWDITRNSDVRGKYVLTASIERPERNGDSYTLEFPLLEVYEGVLE